MNKALTVDQYINSVPSEVRDRLSDLRDAIRDVAPQAKERISYAMPYYDYKGRLVYFAVWKNHIGLYAIKSSVINKYKNELKDKVITKGTIQFPLDKELPLELIKKLVKAQLKENKERAKK